MKITRTSPLTGKETTLDLPVSSEQMARYQLRQELIQNIFPELTNNQREFILTGYTPEDWEAMFPPCCGGCDWLLVSGEGFTTTCNCAASEFFEKKVDEEFSCEHYKGET